MITQQNVTIEIFDRIQDWETIDHGVETGAAIFGRACLDNSSKVVAKAIIARDARPQGMAGGTGS